MATARIERPGPYRIETADPCVARRWRIAGIALLLALAAAARCSPAAG